MYWISFILIAILLSGCNVPSTQATPSPAAASEAAPAETSTPALIMATATIEEVTQQPQVEAVVTITPTNNEPVNTDAVMEGETTVTSINMRSGPTTVHEVVGTYNIGTLVTILGQTPDGDWLYVQPRDNNFGWMYADYVKSYVDLEKIAVMVPTNTIIFHGNVTNTADNSGVSGVGLTILQGSGDEVLSTEATTTESGEFDVYLPDTITGLWRVVIVGTDCDSNIMSDNCTYTGSYSPDLGFTFTLPEISSLEFTYTP